MTEDTLQAIALILQTARRDGEVCAEIVGEHGFHTVCVRGDGQVVVGGYAGDAVPVATPLNALSAHVISRLAQACAATGSSPSRNPGQAVPATTAERPPDREDSADDTESVMSETMPLDAWLMLSCAGQATNWQPDRLHLVFDEPLLRSIAKALAALDAMDERGATLTLPQRDTPPLFTGDQPWQSLGGFDGSFVVGSTWLHVEKERLHIEIWDDMSDDELHGFIAFSELPALSHAIGRHARGGEEALLRRLCDAKTCATAPFRVTTAPEAITRERLEACFRKQSKDGSAHRQAQDTGRGVDTPDSGTDHDDAGPPW